MSLLITFALLFRVLAFSWFFLFLKLHDELEFGVGVGVEYHEAAGKVRDRRIAETDHEHRVGIPIHEQAVAKYPAKEWGG
jgi:hypothetical protein